MSELMLHQDEFSFHLARYRLKGVQNVQFAIPKNVIENMSSAQYAHFATAAERMVDEAITHGLMVQRWTDPALDCEMFLIGFLD